MTPGPRVQSPYLRAFVVARINPLRFKRGAKADPTRSGEDARGGPPVRRGPVRPDQVAQAGGPPGGRARRDRFAGRPGLPLHLLGQETRLVQPGGGNTSIKGDRRRRSGRRSVKGSGTDLRTIGREGFTRLSLARLGAARGAETMSDAEMMRFMAGCMLAEGPAPSVETPLHSLLPHRVIAHTHDVATMSLTNVADGTAERLVNELFEGGIVYVPYCGRGFPWRGP